MARLFSIIILCALWLPAYGAFGGGNAKQYLDEGINLYKQERYFEAIDSLRNAVEINPYYGDAWQYLANTYFALGEYSASLDNALTALKYANNNPDSMIVVADSYRELGQFDKSEKYYQQIIEKNPSYAEVYRNLAELYLKMNKLSAALTMLSKADRVNRSYWKNYLSFGRYYLRSGKPAQAEDYFKKAFNLNPTERQVYVTLADFYRSVGNYAEAISLIETGERLFDNFYSGILISAECYLKTGAWQKALDKFQWLDSSGVRKDKVSRAWLYYKMGLAAENLDKDKTLEYYRQSIEMNPANELARFSMEQFAVKNYPVDDPLRQELAVYHLKRANDAARGGERKKFFLHLKRSATLNPFQTEARRKLVEFYEARGDLFHAYQELKSLEKVDPSYKVKDKIERYEWQLSRGKIRLDEPMAYSYRGMFLMTSPLYNLAPVFTDTVLYNVQYYDKFKFAALSDRKKQGINGILEAMRQNDYTYFVLASTGQDEKSMTFQLYDKTGKILDTLSLSFSTDNLSQTVMRFMDWMDSRFPAVWVIGREISPGTYELQAGRLNGLTDRTELTAFSAGEGSLESLAVLKPLKLGETSSEWQVQTNLTRSRRAQLSEKYAVESSNLKEKLLTKFKRVLGY